MAACMAAGGDGRRGPPSHGGRQVGLAAHGAATLPEGVPFDLHAYFTRTKKPKTGHIRAPAAGLRVNGQPGPKDRAVLKKNALPNVSNERPVPWWSHNENEGLPSEPRPTSIKTSAGAGKLRLSYPNQKRRAGPLPTFSLRATPVQPHGTVLHCPLVPPSPGHCARLRTRILST